MLIFDKKRKHIEISSSIDSLHEVEILFFKNDGTGLEIMEVDFEAFFEKDWQYQVALETDFTLPTV